MAISPAQEILAIDLFGFGPAVVAVEIADRFHRALVGAPRVNRKAGGLIYPRKPDDQWKFNFIPGRVYAKARACVS
jgi:hypothetical protein